MQSLGNTAESVRLYQRSQSIAERLVQRFPSDLRVKKEHYDTLLSLAEAESSLGHSDRAAGDLRAAIAAMQQVSSRNRNDTSAQMELANASVQLGQLLVNGRRAAEAVPYIAHSAEILNRLSAADPANALYRRSLSVVENQYAAALRGAGDAKVGSGPLPRDHGTLRDRHVS